RQRDLVVELDLAELLLERVVAGARLEQFKARQIVRYLGAAGFLQQRRQFRIGQHQPAAEGDAVGLVGDAAGIEMVEVMEHRVPHQVGMHRRDAVDAVRADKGELAHPYPAAALLVDQGTEARKSTSPGARCSASARCWALMR